MRSSCGLPGRRRLRRRTRPAVESHNIVLSAQVMLDAAGFSAGEIDGRAGANLGRAVAAYQQSRGLSVSSRVDEATLERLQEEFKHQPPVVSYTITEADIAGPFQPEIPKDLVEQSKLPSLDYRNPLEALAEKFHASPALLQSLNPGQTFARAGEQIIVPNVTPSDAVRPGIDAPRRRANRGHEAHQRAHGRRRRRPRALLRAGDDRQPARPAAGRPMEGHRRAAVAGVPLQPRSVLGRGADAFQGEDRCRARTTPSASPGSTSANRTTAFTERRSPRRSATCSRTAACG